jgi:hypothetical protein
VRVYAYRMFAYRPFRGRRLGIFSVLLISVALLWTERAFAAGPRVLLMRGWFNVFSTGMDDLGDKLRAKGINEHVAAHTYWDTALAEIVRERAAGDTAPIVLIGHSQGANNSIVLAHSLNARHIPVDLLITLAPFLQDVVPSNVVRAVNYYQSPGWGSPLVPGPGFHGKLSNMDLSSDLLMFHITIDKTSKIHDAIMREIADLPQLKAPPPGKPAVARPRGPEGPLGYARITR